jgi:hypothetical protein
MDVGETRNIATVAGTMAVRLTVWIGRPIRVEG